MISIITITYNAGKEIEATMRSVAEQTYTDYEHIIVDGASKDATLEIVARYASDKVRVYSKPDKGIYHGMSRGLKYAQGDYVIFLNAGDRFASPNTLAAYAAAAGEDADIIYGDTMIVDRDGNILRPRHHSSPEQLTYESYKKGMLVCHQAFMVKRAIAPEFDRRYRLSADYDWSLACIANSDPGKRKNLKAVTIHYLDGGVSQKKKLQSLKERFAIMHRRYGLLPTIGAHLALIPGALKRRLPGTPLPGYYIILFAVYVTLFLYLRLATRAETPSLIFHIFSVLADSSLLMLISLCLRGRWKIISAFIPPILVWIILANLIYFRNFFDMIPTSQYFNNSISDPTVVNSALASFKIKYIFLILASFLPLGYFLCFRRSLRLTNPSRKLYGVTALLFAASLFVTYFGTFRRQAIYNNTSNLKETIEYVFPQDATTWRFFYDNHNFAGYMVRCITTSFDTYQDLTESDRPLIRQRLERGHSKTGMTDEHATPSNLILIVVESLPATVIQQRYKEALPFLWSLTQDSSVIMKKAKVLAGYGRSSDAQFIYNTGLLPLRNEPLVSNYALNNYPSLAKAFGGKALEVIGEDKSLWLHAATSKSYGFAELIDGLGVHKLNQDSLIFRRAIREVEKADKPFMLFTSTLTMHNPYILNNIDHPHEFKTITFEEDRDRIYFERLEFFDRSLEMLFKELDESGKLEDTMIVIAGDHEISTTDIPTYLHDEYVPVIFINAPLSANSSDTITQLDVFPSVMDAMGWHYEFMGTDYRGLGKSIFSETESLCLPTPEDYEISEKIIRTKLP